MTKNHLIPTFLFVLFACQQIEPEFSCNPVINEFVIENREELSQITVEELTSYEIELQRAIFASWNYQKKRSAWIEKLSYVLNNESLTQYERDHIFYLIQHIDEDYFMDENIQKNLISRSLFAQKWINHAMDELGWPEYFVAFMVYRLYLEQSQLEAELSELRSLGSGIIINSEDNCDCNQSADFCGTIDCRPSNCITTEKGCGWLFSMECNGNCY